MTHRSRFIRTLCVVAISIVSAVPLTAQPSKRRAVTPGGSPGSVVPGTVVLNGDVVDSVTSAPIPAVDVRTTTKSGHTNTAGHFVINVPPGQNVVLQFARIGYEPLTANVNITAPASQTFRMIPKPTTTIKMTSGVTYELDTETVEFGYIAPFSGYNKDTKLNLCKAGGDSYTPDRSEIKKITAATQITDTVCCSSGPLPGISVELKSGGITTAGFRDACFGYKVDVIGLEHASANPVYLHFSDIASVTLP